MARYYVNKNAQQDSGDHEVHKMGCSKMPLEQNRIYLGDFNHCHDAVREAKKYYSQSNGCFFCSYECHTS